MILLTLALQAATAPPPAATPIAPPVPQKFSILSQQCGTRDDKGDIVVCANGESNRIPLPDEAGPPAGRGANPNLSARRALELEGTPCAATQWGCQVGFGPPIAPIVGALVGAAKSAFARKPDKRGRVPIDLGE